MDENFILVSLEDSKSKSIAEVIGSKTCKKIISYLSEHKEASQKDLSDFFEIPMNTVEYNIKKLVSSGFIQKRKNFFWSKKGKKIVMYELSNKSIVISHKKSNVEKFKSIVPAFILTGAGTFAVWVFEKINSMQTNLQTNYDEGILMENSAVSKAAEIIPASTLMTPQSIPLWIWFLLGGIIAIFIISIINWRKL